MDESESDSGIRHWEWSVLE